MSRREARDELRQDVALMRELGVERWKTIVLGPSPRAASLAEKPEADPFADLKRKHDVLFAASTIRPPFVAPESPEARHVPRAIVHRRAQEGRRNGEGDSR